MLICRKIENAVLESLASETTPIFSGYLKCSACKCTGFAPKGMFGSSDYCRCSHHFTAHNPLQVDPKKK